MKLKKEVKKNKKKLKNRSFFKINFFNAFYRVPRGTCFDLSKKGAWLFVHIERQQIFLINFFFNNATKYPPHFVTQVLPLMVFKNILKKLNLEKERICDTREI